MTEAYVPPGATTDLLIGCGSNRERRVSSDRLVWAEVLVTLDNVASHKPDVLHDLRNPRLPFRDDTFDEIHAYEVLEHIGQQGDAELLFAQFSDYWRVLKPGGLFIATVPHWTSLWAWGDPSHTRIISAGTLTFLDQAQYTAQVGRTAMSDFRHWYRADFQKEHAELFHETFVFCLRAVKPSRFVCPSCPDAKAGKRFDFRSWEGASVVYCSLCGKRHDLGAL